MKFRKYFRNLPLIAICIVIGTVSGCSSGSGSTSQVNEFSNGFRLVSVTVDNLLFDTLDYTSVLEYNADSSSATVTKTSFDDGVEDVLIRSVEIDSVGRPQIIRSITDPEERQREFIYDSMGRVSRYNTTNGYQTFQYSEGVLQQILYSRLDRLIIDVMLEYSYDAEQRLTSTADRLRGTFTTYEYNSMGQIVTALEQISESRPLFSTSFEYDNNGNMIREVVTRQFGDVYQVNTYEYEETSERTYNYGLMRMKLDPYDAIVFGFVRF